MKVVIDGNQIVSQEELHKILKRELELPDYYGNNLDALYDCLTSWVDLPLTIEWNNFSESKNCLGDYANKVLETFKEAEEELDEFKFLIK
jgi:ribonuclease inhibitor